jgi:hypothetical protein
MPDRGLRRYLQAHGRRAFIRSLYKHRLLPFFLA